ncbi:type IV secretory system conjugative DNA transfer family protein [Streptomyces sp. NBC_01214]|uniref:hypothetical protein n=1 Tax=Streptomyces sp. NBC_01214 TaxID=2903777 RepID=UPI00225C0645|nr:hypothetical protein [Streptomyces sp. NBC_01214]MCX4809004.1 type IV secretory system conjugative DNA transfer family protein [Streptomyces sp. NBC_01214]
MTETAAPYTATAPDPADTNPSESVGEWLGSIGSWLWEHRPTTSQGWTILLVVAAIAVGTLAGIGGRSLKDKGRKERPGLNGFVDAVGEGLAVVLGRLGRLIGRFLAGRPLWGEPRSDATWWRPGTRTDTVETAVPLAQLGAIAAPAAESAGPSPFALWLGKRAAALFERLDAYQGRGQRALEWLGIAIITVGTWLGRLWRMLRAIGRSLAAVGPVLRAMGRLIGSYPRWARAGVLTARVAAVALVSGWLLVPEARGWILLAFITSPLLVVAAAVTGPHGLGWWRGYEPTFADIHAAGLWRALRPALRLDEDAVMQAWLELPHDETADGAAITLRLPANVLMGSDRDRQALHDLLHACLPGQWVAHWQTRGRERFVRWSIDASGPGADAEYGPGLWLPVRRLLAVPEWEPRRDWLTLSETLEEGVGEIRVRIPSGWLVEPEALSAVIRTRMPGDWAMNTEVSLSDITAVFTRKPKPVRPEPLPEYVRWEPTGDPLRVYIGETHDGPAYLLTGSATPHVGVAGETGTGKSTTAAGTLVEARMAGWLVTIIDPKQNSQPAAQGKSGVRYATAVDDCVQEMAEFFTSMMAAEKYNSRAMQGKTHANPPIPRLLMIDELPSFREFIAAWWKYIKQQRGFPPVLVWLALILMQGRSSNHRVFLGTHQFAMDLFGSTMARDQVGTKMVVGETSDPSWAVAFGATTPRVHYDDSIPGRGVISTKRRKAKKLNPDGTPQRVEEIQFAHIDEARMDAYLTDAPTAPAWFDNGEMAPWITDADMAKADSAAAVLAFLPGGEFAPDLTPDTDADATRQGAPVPGQRQGQNVSLTKDDEHQSAAQSAAGAPLDLGALAAQLAQEEPAELRYSLTQACTLGIIDTKPGAARQKKSDWIKRGKQFPEGEVIKGVSYYTVDELHSVYGVPEDWNADTAQDA